MFTIPAAAADVELEADTRIATAGYFQLRWNATGPAELQESVSPVFSNARTIYAGSDRARVMSGKRDGDWYYRVRAGQAPEAPSDVVMVTVRHHPLGRAIGYFMVGAAVFFATLFVIVTNARKRE